MASFSGPVDDEELHNGGDVCNEKDKEKKDETGTKKNLRVVPREYVDKLLSYQCRPPEHKHIDMLYEEDPEQYGYYKALVTECDEISRRNRDIIREYQERIRRDIETKGYVSYEITDDHEGEDDSGGATTSQPATRGKGRRRHRPGVMKHAGGIKKLN